MQRIFIVLILTLSGASAMALEEPRYDVLLTAGDVEFRRYEPYMLAEVTVEGNSQDRRAFRILAGYIFGDNDKGEKMNMTAPVETRGSDYAFVMERKYSPASLPQPDDQRIRIIERQGRVVAALKFSGRWSQSNIRKHERQLVDALAAMEVETTGEPELARFNSPFTPWFLRRNEIIIPVDEDAVPSGQRIATDAPAGL